MSIFQDYPPPQTQDPTFSGQVDVPTQVAEPRIYQDPAAPATAPAAAAAPATAATSPSAALKALLESGMDPQQAAAQINQQFNLPSGSQAVYYPPEAHGGHATVGLPDSYFANTDGTWAQTMRGPGGGGEQGGADGLKPFTGLSVADFMNDPSYTWRLNQGRDIINNNRATSGLLRSGGTLKALTDYGQGAASQEYGAAFNRGLATNQNTFGQNFNLANLGLNATTAGINGANGLASNAGNFANTSSSYANNAGQNITGAGTAAAYGTIGSQNAMNPFYGSLASLFTNPYYRG